MNEHSFKVGDKVRYIGNIYNGAKGVIGTITDIRRGCITVTYNTGICVVCGNSSCCFGNTDRLYSEPNNIEHVAKVGEQLTFSFMKGD